MFAAPARVGRMNRAERIALHSLRVRLHEADPALSRNDSIMALARAADAQGYAIRPMHAAFASPGEQQLLGWLAAFQRTNSQPVVRAPDALMGLFPPAAATLMDLGCRLPYQTILRAGLLDGPVQPAQAALTDQESRRRRATLRRQRGWDTTTMRGKILAFVSARGRATTADICRLGTTRQYISMLRQNGFLVRVGYGVYSVADAGPPKVMAAEQIEIVKTPSGRLRYRAHFSHAAHTSQL